MRDVLAHPDYRKLFTAQVVALLGTGLLTVGLGLFAYDIAGARGGQVLGIAMTIKMLAYVFVSPVMAALTSRLSRKYVLLGANLVRAGVAVCLPFVTEAWQIYVLVFVLQSASATFTPAFQSVIPDLLTDEREYTRALSLSRIAYNLESVISPMLAAALLSFVGYSDLFVGTVIGFVLSALLVLSATVPARRLLESTGFIDRVTRGMRLYVRITELRSLLGMYFAIACGTAMIVVNSAVLVGDRLGLGEQSLPFLLAAAGLGEMVVALSLPRFLDKRPDRGVMLAGSVGITTILLLAAGALTLFDGVSAWPATLVLWFLLGTAISSVITPSGRLIRRNVGESERPAVFAADFSLSHACFIVTYLVAGLVGANVGMAAAALALGLLAILGLGVAVVARPRTSVAAKRASEAATSKSRL